MYFQRSKKKENIQGARLLLKLLYTFEVVIPLADVQIRCVKKYHFVPVRHTTILILTYPIPPCLLPRRPFGKKNKNPCTCNCWSFPLSPSVALPDISVFTRKLRKTMLKFITPSDPPVNVSIGIILYWSYFSTLRGEGFATVKIN